MGIRNIGAFFIAVAITYGAGVLAYTYRVLAARAEFGITFGADAQLEFLIANLAGLGLYGAMLAVALAVGFPVAWGVKSVLKILAPIAYPVAGAAAILTLILIINNVFGGGFAVLAGARETEGVLLQGAAGLLGGIVYAILRPR